MSATNEHFGPESPHQLEGLFSYAMIVLAALMFRRESVETTKFAGLLAGIAAGVLVVAALATSFVLLCFDYAVLDAHRARQQQFDDDLKLCPSLGIKYSTQINYPNSPLPPGVHLGPGEAWPL